MRLVFSHNCLEHFALDTDTCGEKNPSLIENHRKCISYNITYYKPPRCYYIESFLHWCKLIALTYINFALDSLIPGQCLSRVLTVELFRVALVIIIIITLCRLDLVHCPCHMRTPIPQPESDHLAVSGKNPPHHTARSQKPTDVVLHAGTSATALAINAAV